MFCCCVLLSINTHFMRDLLQCWVSPFRQMTPVEKGLLGSRTSFSPLLLKPRNESFAFSHSASARLYEIPPTSLLTFHQSLKLIFSSSAFPLLRFFASHHVLPLLRFYIKVSNMRVICLNHRPPSMRSCCHSNRPERGWPIMLGSQGDCVSVQAVLALPLMSYNTEAGREG